MRRYAQIGNNPTGKRPGQAARSLTRSGSPWQLRSTNRNHYGRSIVQCRWFQPQLLELSIWLPPLSHQERCSCVCSQRSDCSDAKRNGKIWHQMGIVVALIVLAFAAEASSQ
jgi:hypothetical protein